jgi:hypothetical protein
LGAAGTTPEPCERYQCSTTTKTGRGFATYPRRSRSDCYQSELLDKIERELDERLAIPHWTIHDLRRTFVTHVSELGFAQPHVIAAIVNHVSGSKAGVAGVYNKAVYLAERRKALDLWAAHVARLVSRPEPQPQTGKTAASATALKTANGAGLVPSA